MGDKIKWINCDDNLPEFDLPVLVKVEVWPLLKIKTVASLASRYSGNHWTCSNFIEQSKDLSSHCSGKIPLVSVTHWAKIGD